MSNLDLYNAVRIVPKEALKEIQAGRLKGKSDINPVWRIKTLTEQFGPCGIGWKYIITDKRLEKADNGEIGAFVDIDLFIKHEGQWSEAIPGTGGSMFVAQESKGPYVSDECFKMALTDAISVACKALGVAADVYWDKDRTKYDSNSETPPKSPLKPDKQESAGDGNRIATVELVKAVFAAGAERKKNFPDFDMFKWIDEQAEKKEISTKWPYSDPKKTKVNWTEKDVVTLLDKLELPF